VCGVGKGSANYILVVPSKQNFWDAQLSCSKMAADGHIPDFAQPKDWQVCQPYAQRLFFSFKIRMKLVYIVQGSSNISLL
jgi:hypothetical protein